MSKHKQYTNTIKDTGHQSKRRINYNSLEDKYYTYKANYTSCIDLDLCGMKYKSLGVMSLGNGCYQKLKTQYAY